ncbi:MAG: hypothetical protein MUP86_02905 [Dehalococcoidia bacterium]|nr:hypothetical protein [Dehalococcoidia bacterium]
MDPRSGEMVPDDDPQPVLHWKERLFLYVLAIAAAAIMVLAIIGLITVVRWLFGPDCLLI